MATPLADKVQRGHVYAIVDEVDSILIDEARTPLIISGRVADAAKLYYQFASIARSLRRDEDYEVDEEKRTVAPTEDGIERVEQALGLENLYDEVQQNLVHQLYGRPEGQGAVQAGQGLHRPGRRGEDRRRVHRPHPGGPALVGGPPPGRRGQGRGEDQGGEPDPRDDHAAELLPHVRQARRHDRHGPDRGRRADEHLRPAGGAHPHATGRWSATTRPTRSTRPRWPSSTPWSTTSSSAAETGQPVLVGTISVEKSEYLSSQLRKRGVAHEVLNAKQHTREAQIVAQAGRPGAVTVATNMAGRGVDILLGGNPEGLAREEVLPRGLPARGAGRRVQPAGAARPAPRGLPQGPRRGPGPLRRAAREVHAPSARPRATRSASSAGSTCSAPSATRAGASTTSSGAVRAARAIRARAAST